MTRQAAHYTIFTLESVFPCSVSHGHTNMNTQTHTHNADQTVLMLKPSLKFFTQRAFNIIGTITDLRFVDPRGMMPW